MRHNGIRFGGDGFTGTHTAGVVGGGNGNFLDVVAVTSRRCYCFRSVPKSCQSLAGSHVWANGYPNRRHTPSRRLFSVPGSGCTLEVE